MMMIISLLCLPLLSFARGPLTADELKLGYEMALLSQRAYDDNCSNDSPSLVGEGSNLGWYTNRCWSGNKESFGEKNGRVMLATNQGRGMCAVVFRGTKEISEWLRNVDIVPECLDHEKKETTCVPGENVHRGFLNLFLELLHDGDADFDFGSHGARENYYKDWLNKCQSRGDTLVFSGHSLGAGMATIAAMSTQKNYNVVLGQAFPANKIKVVTFGEPRPVYVDCPSFITTENELRFVNTDSKKGADAVPQVPPFPFTNCVGAWAIHTDESSKAPSWYDDQYFPALFSDWSKSIDLHMIAVYVKSLRAQVPGAGRSIVEIITEYQERFHYVIFTGCIVLGAAAVVGSLVALKRCTNQKFGERSYLIRDSNYCEA